MVSSRRKQACSGGSFSGRTRRCVAATVVGLATPIPWTMTRCARRGSGHGDRMYGRSAHRISGRTAETRPGPAAERMLSECRGASDRAEDGRIGSRGCLWRRFSTCCFAELALVGHEVGACLNSGLPEQPRRLPATMPFQRWEAQPPRLGSGAPSGRTWSGRGHWTVREPSGVRSAARARQTAPGRARSPDHRGTGRTGKSALPAVPIRR